MRVNLTNTNYKFLSFRLNCTGNAVATLTLFHVWMFFKTNWFYLEKLNQSKQFYQELIIDRRKVDAYLFCLGYF